MNTISHSIIYAIKVNVWILLIAFAFKPLGLKLRIMMNIG